jgi:hypothetical protein
LRGVNASTGHGVITATQRLQDRSSNGKIRFQSFFMLMTCHPSFLASSYSA